MKLFYNANIYKKDVDTFITDGDRFVEFGNYLSLANKYIYDEEIDLHNKFVYPGFNDSHMHLLNLGIFLDSISLYEHTSSIKDLQRYLKEQIVDYKDDSFIKCRGFNQDYFEEKRMLTRTDLDEVSTTRALIVVRACGHVAVLNSKAISLLGFLENQEIEKGAYNIENGLFEEYAINIINEKLPKPSIDDLKQYLLIGMKKLNSYGITSCQTDDFETLSNVDYKDIIKAYKSLEEEGKLSVRINEQCQFPTIDKFKEYIKNCYKKFRNDEYFKLGPLKLIGDGSLGARTAFLSKGYSDDQSNFGIAIYKQDELDELIKLANKNKIGVCVHCIGDACIDMVLNSYKKILKDVGYNPLQHGIVHVQSTRKDQVDDIIKYNIACYIQSIFIDYDSKVVYEKLGKELADSSYQFKTYLENGVITSNGSDAPVEMPDVLRGMECGITRCSIGSELPYLINQAFSIDQAIDTYTIEGAKMSFEQDHKGLLEKNFLADFVVLDQDIKKVPKKSIHEIKVLETYLGGNRVY